MTRTLIRAVIITQTAIMKPARQSASSSISMLNSSRSPTARNMPSTAIILHCLTRTETAPLKRFRDIERVYNRVARAEIVPRQPTHGAAPVVRQIREFCSGSNSAVRVAELLAVNISARAEIVIHTKHFLSGVLFDKNSSLLLFTIFGGNL